MQQNNVKYFKKLYPITVDTPELSWQSRNRKMAFFLVTFLSDQLGVKHPFLIQLKGQVS